MRKPAGTDSLAGCTSDQMLSPSRYVEMSEPGRVEHSLKLFCAVIMVPVPNGLGHLLLNLVAPGDCGLCIAPQMFNAQNMNDGVSIVLQ